jgi:polysaccharide biosynthesis/export protein
MKVSLLCKPLSSSFRMLLLLAGIALLNSCGNTKKLIYFQEDVKSTHPSVSQVAPTETLIQSDDILSITVSSANPEASVQFNSPNESTPSTNSGASTGNTLTIGYLVNQNGDIQFPVLGTIHVEGLTKLQLTQYITKQLLDKQLLVDPIVTIRYLNFRVSVIGEVMRPGVYTVPNEKLTLMEAIALAGDLSIYGNRDNVSLIRENGKGEKTVQKLNLKSKDILSSPYFYLKSNDIIYIEPIKDRVAMERSQQYLPIVFSLASLLIVVLDRVWK